MRRLFLTLVTVTAMAVLTGCGSPLIRAVKTGDVAAMEKLLDQGADINESAMETGGVSGGTPLFYAASKCHDEAVRFLISKGADVNADDGFIRGGFFTGRPLHVAAENNCFESVRLLLDAGVEIDAKSPSSGSALAIAARNGNIRMAKFLLSRGADVDVALVDLKEPKAIALLEKYAGPVATGTAFAAQSPVIAVVRSDVDRVPYFKTAPRPDAFAVVIGIESYQTVPRSDYSKKDAETVKDYLAALGFRESHIELMTDQRATRSGMAKALEAWLPNQVINQSTVFVYFSGHGAPDPTTGEAFLVPYDGDPNYLGVTGYPLKRLYETLGKLPVKEVVVVLDSCFSGAGGRSVLAKGARPLVMTAAQDPMPPSQVAVLAAAQGSQISTSAPDKGHGILTYYFLKALKDGKTDLADIYTTIKPQVEDAARRLNVRQSPNISPEVESIRGRFDFIN